MKYYGILLLFCFLLAGMHVGTAQNGYDGDEGKKSENKRHSGRWERQDYGEAGRLPDKEYESNLRSSSPFNTDDSKDLEIMADRRASELAANFGIQDPKSQKKLQLACFKYYKAKALLDKEFPDKDHRDRKHREVTLERNFSKELRQVLPQS